MRSPDQDGSHQDRSALCCDEVLKQTESFGSAGSCLHENIAGKKILKRRVLHSHHSAASMSTEQNAEKRFTEAKAVLRFYTHTRSKQNPPIGTHARQGVQIRGEDYRNRKYPVPDLSSKKFLEIPQKFLHLCATNVLPGAYIVLTQRCAAHDLHVGVAHFKQK